MKQTAVYEALEIEGISIHDRVGDPAINFADQRRYVDIKGFDAISGTYYFYNFKGVGGNSSETYNRVLSGADDIIKAEIKENVLFITHPDDHVANIAILEKIAEMAPTFTVTLVIDVDARTRLHVNSLTMQENVSAKEYSLTQMSFYVLTRD